MLAAAKHSDILCLALRNSYSQLDASLQKETTILTEKIKSIILSTTGMKSGFDSLLPQTFKLRIKALKWLSGKNQNLAFLLDEVFPEFEKLLSRPNFKSLGENIIFALRWNQYVLKSLINQNKIEDLEFSETLSLLPEISYEQFLAAVTFNAPEESAQKIVDWVNASLYIEVISLSAMIYFDEQIILSDTQIKEMAELVAEAGKTYLQLSIESGLIRNPEYNHTDDDKELLMNIQQLISSNPSFNFLKEEEELYTIADLKKVFNG